MNRIFIFERKDGTKCTQRAEGVSFSDEERENKESRLGRILEFEIQDRQKSEIEKG